jgi:hypothetical protein
MLLPAGAAHGGDAGVALQRLPDVAAEEAGGAEQ